MSQVGWHNVWEGVFHMPVPTRQQKPRKCGLTMVMDKGLGLGETSELMSVAAKYIDYVKLAFGTPALYSGNVLNKKITLIRSYGIHVYPGGTFLEIAIMQGKWEMFLNRAWELGFTAIEVSDGTVPMSGETRRRVIATARDMGFHVLSEVGKKDPAEILSVDEVARQVETDLLSGALRVIVEARESGKGIGIFSEQGDIRKEHFDELLAKIPDLSAVIWEAPLKKQQQDLILALGANVNLGNVPPGEVLALESLRVGLRGDTLKSVITNSMAGSVK